MRCALLRKPGDEKGLEIDVDPKSGTVSKKPSPGLERLAAAPWTRKHGFGYLRTTDGILKIDEILFDGAQKRVRALVLSPLNPKTEAAG